ncbi:hypothetical protein HPB48_014919 [Haemaphysalis longicornis]|uniref:Methyltransferase type 11 domain-containing protein n=1 Tax=Haemaphysalis longicornis TaxID=44386 RepID=A0A9J6FJB7_HAELO|nr:hypothetical protein HPB48_014919 [Haemaphysalis longicornis]
MQIGTSQVELVRSICGYGEDMAELPDGHFDAVILTYVLCSAIDGRKLLSECKRVLTKVRMCIHPSITPKCAKPTEFAVLKKKRHLIISRQRRRVHEIQNTFQPSRRRKQTYRQA